MFMRSKVNPINFTDDVTKIRPKKDNTGTKNPIVLNNRLQVNLDNFSDWINLSLNTADIMTDSQQVKNGMDNNSPFFLKIT